jgi:hypothetical protein
MLTFTNTLPKENMKIETSMTSQVRSTIEKKDGGRRKKVIFKNKQNV